MQESAKTRRIAVVTTSRADYSHLYWPLRAIQAHPRLELSLIVAGAHLSPRYGLTVEQIRADDFPIAATVESLVSSDSDVGMAKSIGMATLGCADALDRLRPDILLIIADRYEMLAPASVATALRIPIAHIEGGEISLGAIDDPIRHALTKLSHLHFPPTASAAQRVIALGEESWRVIRTGAPSLDHIGRSPPSPAVAELVDGPRPVVVVAVHPVTLLADPAAEIEATFAALADAPGTLLFCFPNADAGNHRIVARAEAYCARHANARLLINLPAPDYFELLRRADAMVGNSSSGIMEAASFELPVVNVGRRQEGRERARNVIDVPAVESEVRDGLRKALTPSFRAELAGLQNPYGDGNAGEKIAAALAAAPEREQLLFKQPFDG